MEEKRKSNIGIIICIIIIISLIIALFGMWYYYNHLNKQQESKVNKVYEDKDIVYSSYTGEIDNPISEGEKVSINKPYINIKSSEIEEINKEIDRYYDFMSEGGGPVADQDYKFYLNDNILSVVIIMYTPSPTISYKVYNIDIYEGKELSNLDILRKKNITKTDFIEKLKDVCSKKFIKIYGTREEWIKTQDGNQEENYHLFDEQYKNTIANKNCTINTMMFLGDKGKLNVIPLIYSLAGADYYYYIVETDI